MKNKISIEVLVLKRLGEMHFRMKKEAIISFPELFARICPIFCLTKNEAWTVFRSMGEKGIYRD